ncbi:MAG: cohesin domain-containing protein [Candidatus Sulfotelmatobacter sp.]
MATGAPSAQAPASQAPAAQPSANQIANQQASSQSASPAAQGASFLFDPSQITVAKGNTFVVNLLISGAQNVYSVPVQLNYDPAKLQLVNISNGGFLSQDGQAVALVHREDDTTGTLQITATRPPGAGGVSGQGAVVTMTFQAKASGQTPLTITRGGARDPGLQAISVNGAQASVTVQ